MLSGWYLPQGIVNVKNYKTDDLSFNVRWTETNAPKGIEPGSQEWESSMIPLHQRRVFLHHDTIFGSVISIQLRSAISHRSAITTLHNWNSRHHALTILYTSNSHNHNLIQLIFFYNFKQHKLNLHRHTITNFKTKIQPEAATGKYTICFVNYYFFYYWPFMQSVEISNTFLKSLLCDSKQIVGCC